jgi:hypothetical protein
MRYLSLLLVVALPVALLSCARRTPEPRSQMPPAPARTANPVDTVVATQIRLNRYFSQEVIPKVGRCWRGVRGEGMMGIKFTYTNTGDRWTWEQLEGESSTLPRGQEAVALRCM